MGKSLFDLLLDSIFDDAWVGKRGEKMTERERKQVQLFGRKGKVLRNVNLPKECRCFSWTSGTAREYIF